MFSYNWYSAPTFAAMLLFWVMACYILTRSPITAITVTAVGALATAAAYLLGQGILANAATAGEWRAWADKLQWAAPIAPTLWYWVTALLLRDQPVESARRYLRRVGYPVGILLAILCLVLTASIYVEGWLYSWNHPEAVPPDLAGSFRFRAPEGPL